jgi:hypothetical protein
MKEEEAINWRKRFPTFHWTRRTSLRRGHRRFTKMSGIVCVGFLEEKEEKESAKFF